MRHRLPSTFRLLGSYLLLGSVCALGLAAPVIAATKDADRQLSDYFRKQTDEIAKRCLADIRTLEDWNSRRTEYRRQLHEMLGLDPLPPRTELNARVTGSVDRDSFRVENLHFQSLPGLYVTANLYLPKAIQQRAPTVLYVCGHGPVISNGVSYGNKVAYQHHGAWFARNGYVCLIIDTLQLGEIEGLHHGTYRERMWWWNSRGYTPAGVEAWNSIRALDYLATRPEVDANRFGVTGRSGGGAYSWWLAALDDRVKVAAPVAGITDLHNHVVDGVVEGHCDCMFTVNTYRWDYPQVAALVAPRPLLIVNTDSDSIFPLDGVMRTHEKVRQIYRLHNAATNLGLVIGPGPHKDTQDLQVPVFRWFNRHLKGEDPPIDIAATKFFTPQQLKVFKELPADAVNTNIQANFVPETATAAIPNDISAWHQQTDLWMSALRTKVFGGWPINAGTVPAETRTTAVRDGIKFEFVEFQSQENVPLRMYVFSADTPKERKRVVLRIIESSGDELEAAEDWTRLPREQFEPVNRPPIERSRSHLPQAINDIKTTGSLLALMAPRGIGADAWSGDARKQTHIRRRFMLLGQTLDTMRVWDIRQALRLVRQRWPDTPIRLQAGGDMAVNALYASIFENGIAELKLSMAMSSHMDGPDYLNVLRVLDLPQAVAMAAERCPVRLESATPERWFYAKSVDAKLNWRHLQIVSAANP